MAFPIPNQLIHDSVLVKIVYKLAYGKRLQVNDILIQIIILGPKSTIAYV